MTTFPVVYRPQEKRTDGALTQAVVEIPFAGLEKLLRLPDNCRVASVRRVPNDEALEIKIDGPMLPLVVPRLDVGDPVPLQPIPFATIQWEKP